MILEFKASSNKTPCTIVTTLLNGKLILILEHHVDVVAKS